MATAIRQSEVKGARSEPCALPTFESVKEAVRTARRTATEARIKAEDFAAGASLEVRRHPFAAVGLAAASGILAGCVVGFAAGWFTYRRG
jgi:ElaB/YqjD/DUF883 family membrane-anchored ribosome-binding protein